MHIDNLISKFLNLLSNHYDKYLLIILKVVFIIVIIKLVHIILTQATRRFFRPSKNKSNFAEKSLREKTLVPIFLSAEKYVLYFIGLISLLKVIGIDTSAILASAGVVGLAFGFGAQSLVKDFISGFFIMFDGLIKVGDVITVSSVTGEVEKIDLRNTMVREFSGRIWAIPNGDIRTFGNFNRDFVRAIVEVGVAYESDVNQGMDALMEVANAWAAKNNDIILEEPAVQGINNFGDSNVIIRLVIKLKPLKHWTAERELRKMLKEKFDEYKIEIPFPRRVVYQKS